MKAVAVLCLFLVSVVAATSSHDHHHLHRKTPMHRKARRVTMTNSEITSTTEIPHLAIYTDEEMQVRTATEVIVMVPPTQSASESMAEPTTKASHPAKAVFGGSTNNSSHPIKRQTSGLTGVTYAPYNGDGTCKTASEVSSDFEILAGQYAVVRIYGVDCNQLNTVLPAAREMGLQMMLGLFNLDTLDSDIDMLVQGVQDNGGWDIIDTVSVGNELVNNRQATAEQMVEAVTSTRESLRTAGFNGPVVVVDTFVAVLDYPSICDSSDFCAMNIHPFFDSNTAAPAAGQFVATQVARVRKVLADSNQRVVVTESGWPTQGNSNGLAVPGIDNQAAAIQSLLTNYAAGHPLDLFLFTAFNDPWKLAESWTFYAEPFWGMNDD